MNKSRGGRDLEIPQRHRVLEKTFNPNIALLVDSMRVSIQATERVLVL
jgi:hypothetical protein